MIDILGRAKILLKATKELLEKQENSFYVMNLLEETVFYDGVDCDGSCLKDDIGYWFDELEDTPTVKAIPLDKVKEAREEIEEYKKRQLTLAIGVEDLEQGKQVALDYVISILDKLIESEE
jgi:hypothetical protein